MKKQHWIALAGLLTVLAGVVLAILLSRTDGDKGNTIKIAIILPQTGPQAAIGRGATNSATLAFRGAKEELRKKGLDVELVVLDDASKPETALAQAQKVASSDDVVLAIAHFNTPCALATMSTFHEAGVPVIVPAAVGSRVTANGYREVVRTVNTDLGQATYMAKYLRNALKATRIYAIDDSSAFGTGLVGALQKELSAEGTEVIGRDSFHVGDVDFSPVLARIAAASPDVVVVGCMATEGALFRKQMVQRNLSMPLVGFSGIFYDTYLKAAGDAAEGTMAIFPLPPLDVLPGGRAFQEAYKKAGFNEPYESAGPFCYVAGQVAVQALLKGARTRADMVAILRKDRFDTAFGPVGFDERGEMTLKMFSFYAVEGGTWHLTYSVNSEGKIVPKKD